MTGDAALADAVMRDYRTAPLSPRERAMLDWAVRATGDAHSLGREDVDALRAAGLGDGAVLELAHVVGFFNSVNRIADALGIDPEPSSRGE